MSAPPPTERVRAIIGNVRARRQRLGWTVQDLTDKMVAAGCPLQRSVLTNLEHGRRSNVTVDELWTFAEVFGVRVEALLAPVCQVCAGIPPAGFICASCGVEAA